MTDATEPAQPDSFTVRFGHDELVIRKRYEVLSIVNDILIGVWFVVGSVFFFYESLTTAGTGLFVAGSVELLIRPVIRLARHVHLQKVGTASSLESPHDY
jgi:hypothetical protein